MDLITPDFGLIFWQSITLLAVLLVLSRFAWSPILQIIQAREQDIAVALQSAQEAKRLVERVKEDKASLIREAHAEREKIIAEAVAAKQEIMAQAKLAAEAATQSAIAQTKALLEKEKEAARAVLQNEVASLSIQVATKLLQHELQQQQAQEQYAQRLVKEANWA